MPNLIRTKIYHKTIRQKTANRAPLQKPLYDNVKDRKGGEGGNHDRSYNPLARGTWLFSIIRSVKYLVPPGVTSPQVADKVSLAREQGFLDMGNWLTTIVLERPKNTGIELNTTGRKRDNGVVGGRGLA